MTFTLKVNDYNVHLSNLLTEIRFTPPKTNMEPENTPDSGKGETSTFTTNFCVPAISFWGCNSGFGTCFLFSLCWTNLFFRFM